MGKSDGVRIVVILRWHPLGKTVVCIHRCQQYCVRSDGSLEPAQIPHYVELRIRDLKGLDGIRV